MSQKSLAASLFVLFFISAWYLFALNERGLDPDAEKDWWSVEFSDPGNPASLAFTVRNYSDQTAFSYVVRQGSVTLEEGSLTLSSGQSGTADPKATADSRFRTTIVVSDGSFTQEIFR